jgi:predicted alpha/beta hydrolase family esterase
MIVIVYGYDGSGPGHWQRWLESELRQRRVPVVFPELPDPLQPSKDVWVARLADVVGQANGDPVTFVCHSLGCWAVDHLLAERGAHGVHAALLVAPPSPHLLFEPVESFLPPPRQRAAWAPIAPRSLLVGSDDDQFTAPDELAAIARSLDVSCSIIPRAGHINTATGYGPWPFVMEWLASVGADVVSA